MEYTRKELIKICEDAVVHHTLWNNRDSYSAQMEIYSIHKGLTAGLDFKINKSTDEKTIWIDFINVDKDKLKKAQYLSISDIDDYFRDCDSDHETEMFIGNGIDFNSRYTSGYMPTRERLEKCDGNDWY